MVALSYTGMYMSNEIKKIQDKRQQRLTSKERIDMGKCLRGLREDKKWSRQQMGKKIGCSSYTIGRYERGESEPPLAVLVSYSAVFKKSLDNLVFGEKETKENKVVECESCIFKKVPVNEKRIVKRVLKELLLKL